MRMRRTLPIAACAAILLSCGTYKTAELDVSGSRTVRYLDTTRTLARSVVFDTLHRDVEGVRTYYDTAGRVVMTERVTEVTGRAVRTDGLVRRETAVSASDTVAVITKESSAKDGGNPKRRILAVAAAVLLALGLGLAMRRRGG